MRAHPGGSIAFSFQRAKKGFWAVSCLVGLVGCTRENHSETGTKDYLEVIRRQAAELRAQDHAPISREAWEKESAELRRQLSQAWGAFPNNPAPLEPKVLGVIQKDGYRIEKLIFQTFPGVFMTANAYVPTGAHRAPALLSVHGHWHGAKQDPVTQSHCVGPVRLGYFVLAVDAFGAGERGIGKALGEDHGDMTAATLLPAGLSLPGIQVYENMRAVDYLQSRPEVDPDKIAITGASGGGNQTMYAGAWDPRFKAVVPVCSVGNYQAYLGAYPCLCELTPGILRFTEESKILGLVAPRALLVMNATRDGVEFSVAEAKKSVDGASPIFTLFSHTDHLAHASFEADHGYDHAMRERLNGWLAFHLKGAASPAPVAEPVSALESAENLRCFPNGTRPDNWVTLPQYAAQVSRHILQDKPWPKTPEDWESQRRLLLQQLTNVLGLTTSSTSELPIRVSPRRLALGMEIEFSPEPGINLRALYRKGEGSPRRTAIVLSLEGADAVEASQEAQGLLKQGWGLATLDLRATGKLKLPRDRVGRAPDHVTAQAGLWIGRPLLGQWTQDVLSLIDALNRAEGKPLHDLRLVGLGSAGLVAYCVAALDTRVTHVVTRHTLGSYVSDVPYKDQRLGTIVPGILPRVGDIPHLASLIAPRRLLVAEPLGGHGRLLKREELGESFKAASQVWALTSQPDSFRVAPSFRYQEFIGFLSSPATPPPPTQAVQAKFETHE